MTFVRVGGRGRVITNDPVRPRLRVNSYGRGQAEQHRRPSGGAKQHSNVLVAVRIALVGRPRALARPKPGGGALAGVCAGYRFPTV